MFAELNGTRLFFDVEGMGFVPENGVLREKPVCFILHGGPGGTHAGYKPHLSPLAETMQLIYVDYRGSGFSAEGPEESYTLENNVDDLEALRKYLGLNQILLHGHSYGGMVAMSYALKYPEHVQGLILLTTAPSYRFLERAKETLIEIGTPEQLEMGDVLWAGAFESTEQLERYYEVMAPLYSHKYDPEQAKKRGSSNSKRCYQALNQGFGGFLRTFDITDQLPSIHVPTLVMAGRHDWITTVDQSEIIAEHIPNSKLIIFEESSHNVIGDEYEKYLATVKQFVDQF